VRAGNSDSGWWAWDKRRTTHPDHEDIAKGAKLAKFTKTNYGFFAIIAGFVLLRDAPSAVTRGVAAIRIISGTLKGRRLRTPDWPGLRPTSDRLRETLFNVLGQRLDGWRVLDAFAGTGAVGIEALSRGAAEVTFVEHDARAAALIAENLAHCGVTERYAIIRVDFAGAAARLMGARFDLVFLDPPYGAAALASALEQAEPIASEGTTVVIEHARRDTPPERSGRLHLTRALPSGDSALAFYSR
jgi:16S rRNA (guanine966-N2)-methyltransferase